MQTIQMVYPGWGYPFSAVSLETVVCFVDYNGVFIASKQGVVINWPQFLRCDTFFPKQYFYSVKICIKYFIIRNIFILVVSWNKSILESSMWSCWSMHSVEIPSMGVPQLHFMIRGSRTLWWRHNGCDSVSNHQPHNCLLNRILRRRLN